MKLAAILPIKKHSERVPDKNFRMLGPKPLWRHIADTVLPMDEVDNLIIDTDCPNQFASFAMDQEKVIVHPRAEHLCFDEVSMNMILADVVRLFGADVYLQVHATSPFVTEECIKAGLRYVDSEVPGYDSVYSVSSLYQRAYLNGKPINHDGSLVTQGLTPIVFENSAFFLFKREPFLKYGHRICGRTGCAGIGPITGLDIDEEVDWKIAEALQAQREKEETECST